ncbi:helix-turn-helix domain-containing protein [Pelotomaculum propionicicum]|uniref:helix-turn-helix domain-containing protein n=1 Tax=Pelotomaculum propionicicum TaxID=258475 RepID=UPI003B7F91DB
MFKKRLISLRKSKKLTQIKLAKILKISRGALSMYEIGQREPDYATLQRIADYFNVSTDYLLGRTNILTPSKYMDIIVHYIKVINEWEKEGRSPEEIKVLWEKIENIASRYKLK